MAKMRPVKCLYCGEMFDRTITDFVQVTKLRYAHKICYDKHISDLSQEEKDITALHNYIKTLFNIESLTPRITKQIQTYHENNNYTYSGILKSLVYFYQIKGNDISKANGGIGIVPYIYEEARTYYTAIWMAQQQNLAKPIQQYKPNTIQVEIPPPIRKEKKKKYFSFLDEGED